jgi:hypothetical protein
MSWPETIVYGHGSGEPQNPRKIRVFNRLFREGFLARGIVAAKLYATVSIHDQ